VLDQAGDGFTVIEVVLDAIFHSYFRLWLILQNKLLEFLPVYKIDLQTIAAQDLFSETKSWHDLS